MRYFWQDSLLISNDKYPVKAFLSVVAVVGVVVRLELLVDRFVALVAAFSLMPDAAVS